HVRAELAALLRELDERRDLLGGPARRTSSGRRPPSFGNRVRKNVAVSQRWEPPGAATKSSRCRRTPLSPSSRVGANCQAGKGYSHASKRTPRSLPRARQLATVARLTPSRPATARGGRRGRPGRAPPRGIAAAGRPPRPSRHRPRRHPVAAAPGPPPVGSTRPVAPAGAARRRRRILGPPPAPRCAPPPRAGWIGPGRGPA